VPATASAQRRGELTLFSQPNFRGQSFTVTGPRENLGLQWTVRSLQVVRGETWELCARTAFRTPCRQFQQSAPSLNQTVASARPAVVHMPEPAPPNRQSLRGMNAEFFVAPTDNGARVISCAAGTAACARTSANRFCRSRGWGGASFEQQQTINRRNYLADVLCTRTGG
jgi:hypothetical protein